MSSFFRTVHMFLLYGMKDKKVPIERRKLIFLHHWLGHLQFQQLLQAQPVDLSTEPFRLKCNLE